MIFRSRLRRALLVVTALGLTTPSLARKGGGDNDIGHEAARRLVEAGRILSLEAIVSKVAEHVPGKLIATKLESDQGQMIYELKILRPEGRVQEVEIDATTGKILKIEDDD